MNSIKIFSEISDIPSAYRRRIILKQLQQQHCCFQQLLKYIFRTHLSNVPRAWFSERRFTPEINLEENRGRVERCKYVDYNWLQTSNLLYNPHCKSRNILAFNCAFANAWRLPRVYPAFVLCVGCARPQKSTLCIRKMQYTWVVGAVREKVSRHTSKKAESLDNQKYWRCFSSICRTLCTRETYSPLLRLAWFRGLHHLCGPPSLYLPWS